jgi:sugar transferase (PEP-CTERM/EpsH1 system associated)
MFTKSSNGMSLNTEPQADQPGRCQGRCQGRCGTVAPGVHRPTVCQVLHSLNVGGAEVLTARLVRRLAASYRLVLVCLDELGLLGQELRHEGFPVEVLHRKPGLDWKCAARFGRYLRRQRVDLVHAHQYTPFFYALAARWMHRRAPILFLEHGRHQPDYPRRKRIFANRMLLERRDRIIGVGEAVRRALIDNEGLPEARVGVIYNGIDIGAFTGSGRVRAEVRQELNLPANAFVLVQVARLDPIKDHGTAVRSFARLAEQRPDSRFLLVGDGPERPAIEQLISQHGLSERVHVLGTRTDVKRLLAGADLFVLSSTSEGIPLTLIEAMAAGLPVVATRVGGVAEVVEHGKTGFLVPAGDVAGLAERMVHLADNAAERTDLGQRGRSRAEALFSEDAMIARYDRLYRDMLRGGARHG